MKLNNTHYIHYLVISVLVLTGLSLWIYNTYLTYDIGEYGAYLLAKKMIIEKYDKSIRCGGNFENNMYPSWSRGKNKDTNEISYGNIQDNDGSYLFSSDNGTCSIIVKIYPNGQVEDSIIAH